MIKKLFVAISLIAVTGCTMAEPELDLVPCVPGQRCIVGLDPAYTSMALIGTTIAEVLPEINALVVIPTEEDIGALAQSATIRYAELDGPVHVIEPAVMETEEIHQWHLDQIGVNAAWKITRGDGQIVGVVDTGVDCTHPDLVCRPGTNVVDSRVCGPGSSCDGHGHGTHVAGIATADGEVSGVAPAADVLPVKAIGDSGTGSMSGVARGIIWAADRANVINLSLGSPAPSRTLQEAIEYARKRDVVVVVARGNYGSTRQMFPACYDVIAVTATDKSDRRTNWSSHGRCGEAMLIGAPGLDIVSTVPGGGHATMSGTSMAAPVVSGVAALLLANGQQVEGRLRAGAIPIGNPSGEVGVAHAGRSVVGAPPGPTPTQRPTVEPEPTNTRSPYPGPTKEPTSEPSPTDESPTCDLVEHTILVFDGRVGLIQAWVYECD